VDLKKWTWPNLGGGGRTTDPPPSWLRACQIQLELICSLTAMSNLESIHIAPSRSVCISVPLWQIQIFGLFFHAKSGYPDFLCRSV